MQILILQIFSKFVKPNKKKIVLEKKSLNSYETGKTVSNYLNNNKLFNKLAIEYADKGLLI